MKWRDATLETKYCGSAGLFILLCFFVFCLSKLLAVDGRAMDYDSGYFGAVAKNVMNGYGYATSHSERILFNPEITTGPAVVYPLALLMAVLGNQEFLPQYYIAVTNLLLVGLFSALFIRAYGANVKTAVFLLSLYLLGTLYEPLWWTICIGDMQVIIIMLNAALIIGTPILLQNRYQAALLGALLAFGILVKFSLLMALPALMLALLIQVWARTIRPSLLPVVLLAFLVLFLPFYIYKHIELQNLPPEVNAAMQNNALTAGANRQAAGVGIFLMADDKLNHVKKSFNRSRVVLVNLFSGYGLPKGALYFILLCPLAASFFYLAGAIRKSVSFPVILAWLAASFIVWKFGLSLAFQAKYTLPVVWFSALFVFYILIFRLRMVWLPVAILCLLPLLMSSDMRSTIMGEYFHNQDSLEYRKDTENLVSFIAQYSTRPPLAYCGWGAIPRSVFYRLPGSETTPDCYGILAKQIIYRDEEDANWVEPVSFWLVRDKKLMPVYPNDIRRFEQIKTFCDPLPLFDSRYYDLYNCPWSSVRYVVKNRTLVQDILHYDDPLF